MINNTLEFENFSIKLEGLVEEKLEEGTMYTTDARISLDEFKSFIAFYLQHNRFGNYFNTVINEKGFYGRFGQLIYSKNKTNYHIRLVFVESKFDIEQNNTESAKDIEHLNLLDLVSRQEVIIKQLTSVLQSKGFLSTAELNDVYKISEEQTLQVRLEIVSKVKDLNEYLKNRKETLDDIRKEYE